ncbi:hypothetical protein ACMD2_21641 [Ananas comosus]|uniref:Uncharacterized protein n=1 Tax=Ananas comosus TaxID=4615 RepID=A0A199VLL3_ANACO|nr:hypothetical protein ACMD2_21641 [Ananas comosus]
MANTWRIAMQGLVSLAFVCFGVSEYVRPPPGRIIHTQHTKCELILPIFWLPLLSAITYASIFSSLNSNFDFACSSCSPCTLALLHRLALAHRFPRTLAGGAGRADGVSKVEIGEEVLRMKEIGGEDE